MHPIHRPLLLACLALSLALLAACARPLGGESAPNRYYVLSALPQAAGETPAAAARSAPAVGIGPVTLAQYLNHKRIATRDAQNRLTLADFDLWAAPLDEEIASVLAENLTAMIPTDRVLLLGRSGNVPIDYRVKVDIARFERNASGKVVLIARWTVLDAANRKELAFGRSVIDKPLTAAAPPADETAPAGRPAAAAEYEAIVRAMSDALADLSREIAAAIKAVSAEKARAKRPQQRSKARRH